MACFCFECKSQVDCEADVCSNCGASQIPYKTAFFSTIAKKFIKRAAVVIGSITLAALLRAAVNEAFNYFDIRGKYGISNETGFFILLGVAVAVVAAIVFFRNRKGVESELNLKD